MNKQEDRLELSLRTVLLYSACYDNICIMARVQGLGLLIGQSCIIAALRS